MAEIDYPSSNATPPPLATTRRRLPGLPRPGRPRLPFGRGRGDEAKAMTLVEHLTELRHRVFVSLFSLIPGAIVGYLFSDQIIHVLKAPLPTKEPLTALGLAEPFMIHLQIALIVGVIIAMPVMLYQLWAFISPGLTPTERSAARPWVPLALLFFLVGVGVAYFILPFASGFLYGFQTSDIHLLLTAEAYFGFITMLFLAFGLVMEFPIVLVLLAKVGLVSSRWLRGSRKKAFLGIVLFSTLVTPGADIVSPIAMAAVMYVLYEFSIVLIRANGL